MASEEDTDVGFQPVFRLFHRPEGKIPFRFLCATWQGSSGVVRLARVSALLARSSHDRGHLQRQAGQENSGARAARNIACCGPMHYRQPFLGTHLTRKILDCPGKMQSGRHDRRPQEVARRADGHAARKAADPKVVHRLQGPHHARRLRDSRWHGSRALLCVLCTSNPLSRARSLCVVAVA